jgi:hypothetical protein
MFNSINYLLFEKGKTEIDSDLLAEFSPWMTMRYLSFASNDFVEYTNETLNKYCNLFQDSADTFRFYQNVIYKSKKKKIPYIKVPKKDPKEVTEEYPIPEFLSKREIEIYENLFDN